MLPTRLSDRLRLLQWALPAAITVLAALYQLGPARYVHDHFGNRKWQWQAPPYLQLNFG